MISADYISARDTTLTLHQHLETGRQDACLCFVCDGATNGSDSVPLQYSQTTHSKTGLPIKLGQLIGDGFMVVVSVNDRLCFTCIKLINLADKLELEFNTVKKVITEHLKAKYQLLDENVDHTNCTDDSKRNNKCDEVKDVQQKFNIDLHNNLSTDTATIDKTDNLVKEVIDPNSENDGEIIKGSRVKSENDKTLELSLGNKVLAGKNKVPFIVKEPVKQNTENVDKHLEARLHFNKISNSDIEAHKESDSRRDGENKTDIEQKANHNTCQPLNRPIFKCTMCEDKFQTHVLLRKHIMSTHLTKWSCHFCGITFSNDGEYQKHMQTHIKVQLSSSKGFDKTEDLLNRDPKALQKEKCFFKCKTCKFKTRFNYLLDKHECLNAAGLKNVNRDFKCPTCLHYFKTRKQLDLHKCINMVTISKNSSEKSFKYECGICSVTFSTKSDLVLHLKTHKTVNKEMKNQTKDVTEIIQVDVDLGNDMVPINESVRNMDNIQCNLCSLTFNEQSLYSEHMERIHGKNSVDDTVIESSGKNTSTVNEIYFGNIRHFMALTTPNVEDEMASTVKENTLSTNITLPEDCEERKDININDLVITGSLTCEKCDLSFNDKSEYEKHLVMYDHKNFPYQNFIKIDGFDNFGNKNDENKNSILEPLQSVNKLNVESLGSRQNVDKYNNLSCQNCTFIASTLDELKKHINCEHILKDELMVCNICNTYVNKDDIDNHYRSKHKNINCKYCSFETKNKELMRRHIKEHNNKTNGRKDKQQGYLCQFCSETFKTKKLLQLHEELHPENFEYDCSKCNKKFMKERQLKRHYDEVHRDPHCYYCGKEILNLKALKNHEQRHIRDLHNSKQLECDICKRIFKTRTGLRHHFAIHTGKFKYFCDFCQRGFMSRMMLEEHRSRHTKEDRYVCDVCGRKFTFQSTYWIHRKWHDTPFPYKCNFCGRLFRHTSLLAVHKRKHTGERPYKCPHCPLSFTVGGTLKRHLILHTQKFPYTCETCKRGFTTKHKYSTHLAKMHNNYELLNDKKLMQKDCDFKMVVKEKTTIDCKINDKVPIEGREQSENFDFIPDSNFTLVNMEEDDTGNSGIMMPCIMAVNNEENSGLVFEIISGSPLQPMSNGIGIAESAILPDMWCE